ncbi:PCYCGC domain-containing protein (plasmid) [Metabacillus halosaccharovorans]|nr:PCYCGC domain-containing protein [Metabacillus halosaccharovorans]
MPCYCVCGDYGNHKSNYNCFVYESKENGAIIGG